MTALKVPEPWARHVLYGVMVGVCVGLLTGWLGGGYKQVLIVVAITFFCELLSYDELLRIKIVGAVVFLVVSMATVAIGKRLNKPEAQRQESQ